MNKRRTVIAIDPTRPAFTLAEAIISMSILVVLVGGLTSAVVLSTRALPANSVQRDTATRVGNAAAQIAEEMRAALWFIERTATAVTFTVPDRNSDGVPERIRYSWSGTIGADLHREVNGGGQTIFVAAVEAFAIEYRTAVETETFVGAPVESSNTTLRSYRAAAPLANCQVTTARWGGEYFRPTLPANALSWAVKNASIFVRSNGTNNGVNSFELQAVNGSNAPTGSALATQSLLESSLSGSYTRYTANFSGVSGLSPTAGLCLIVRGVSGSSVTAECEYQSSGVVLPNAAYLSYSGAWTVRGDAALSFEVVGTYITPGGSQTMERTFVTGVDVSLAAAGQPATVSARTLNRPEALSAMWSTDFTGDPARDGNGDGMPDWEVRSGTLNLALLVADSWTGTQRLYSMPNCNYTRPTRARVRFRAAAAAGSAAVFLLPFAWTGGTTAGIVAYVVRESDGTQTMTVATKTSDDAIRTLTTVAGLADRTIELGLRLNPTLQTVNIETDGRSRGTYTYDRYAPVSDTPNASIFGTGGGAVFESVSIRVDE